MNQIIPVVRSSNLRVTPTILISLLFLLGLTLVNSNPLETLASFILFIIIVRLFWRNNTPFAIVYCLIWQWLEISTSLWESNYYGETLNQTFNKTGLQTYWLAFFGLVSITLGLFFSTRKTFNNRSYQNIDKVAQEISIQKLARLYAIFFVASIFISGIAFSLPSITQLLLHIVSLKTAIYLCICYAYFFQKKQFKLFFLISVIEFIAGLYSYFSSFKIVFIVILLSYVITIKKIDFKKIISVASLVSIAFFVLLIWQTIKTDYRNFLSGGKQSQNVSVSFTDSMTKLFELTSNHTDYLSDDKVKGLFRRVGYLEYFALTVNRVPNILPHENGQLLIDNLSFVLLPRILNAAKGVKDDTKKTSKYTGLTFAGIEAGTSFSLSYYAETFIDFGPIGMMFMLFSLACFVGMIYNRFMAIKSYNPLFKYSLVTVVLFPFASYGSDMIFLFGMLFWGTFVHLILFKKVYIYMNKWLLK